MATDRNFTGDTIGTPFDGGGDTATKIPGGLRVFTAVNSMRSHWTHCELDQMLITQTSLNNSVRATGAGRRTVHEKGLGPAQATV